MEFLMYRFKRSQELKKEALLPYPAATSLHLSFLCPYAVVTIKRLISSEIKR